MGFSLRGGILHTFFLFVCFLFSKSVEDFPIDFFFYVVLEIVDVVGGEFCADFTKGGFEYYFFIFVVVAAFFTRHII